MPVSTQFDQCPNEDSESDHSSDVSYQGHSYNYYKTKKALVIKVADRVLECADLTHRPFDRCIRFVGLDKMLVDFGKVDYPNAEGNK
jgi:hypothetical protein